jgi:hypothetical protein
MLFAACRTGKPATFCLTFWLPATMTHATFLEQSNNYYRLVGFDGLLFHAEGMAL